MKINPHPPKDANRPTDPATVAAGREGQRPDVDHVLSECLHEMAHLERGAAERGAARLLLGKLAAVKGNRGRNRLIRAMKYLADPVE